MRSLGLALPAGERADAGVQHVAGQLVVETELFGKRYEAIREDQPELGVMPAQQPLRAARSAMVVDLDLIVEFQLFALERAAQVAQQAVALRLPVHRGRVEQRHAVAAGALGFIHGNVGAFQDLVGARLAAVEDHDADACRRRVADLAEVEGLVKRCEHLSRRGDAAARGVGLVGARRLDDDDELVAADARHQVLGRHALAQPVGHLHEEGVADVMALRVVQRFEVVEVDEEQDVVVAASLAARQRLAHAVQEHSPVGQFGKRIEVGQLLDFHLVVLADRHVRQIAVPGDVIGAEFRRGGNAGPFVLTVAGADTEFVLPAAAPQGRILQRLAESGLVALVDELREKVGIGDEIGDRDAGDALQRRAGIGDRRGAVVAHHELEQRAGQFARQLAELFLELQPLQRLGDLADRTLVIGGRAFAAVHDKPRRFRDPDALAGLVSVNLGDEVLDLAVPLQDLAELVAAGRVDIPFVSDVGDRRQHFGFALIAVQAHQRLVGADLAAVQGRAIDPFRQVFDEIAVLLLRKTRGEIELPVAEHPQTEQHRQDEVRGHQPVLAGAHLHQRRVDCRHEGRYARSCSASPYVTVR